MILKAEEFVPNYLIGHILPDNIYSFENYKYYIERYWNVILNYIEDHIELDLNYTYIPLYNGTKNFGAYCPRMKLRINDSTLGDGISNKKEEWFTYYKNNILDTMIIPNDYLNKIKISMEDFFNLLINFIIKETNITVNNILYEAETEKINILSITGDIK